MEIINPKPLKGLPLITRPSLVRQIDKIVKLQSTAGIKIYC